MDGNSHFVPQETSLSATQLECIVEKLLRALDRVETLDLPQYINQLLLISMKVSIGIRYNALS